MALARIAEMDKFLGVDNVHNRENLPPGFLFRAINCDIDNDGFVRRRRGFQRILAGDARSLWSNGTVCLYADGTMLKRLHDDFSTELILNGLDPNLDVEFVDVNGVIYFTNNEIIGFIENGRAYPFPDVDTEKEPFKRRMVGGHLIEYYNGRLYVAQESSIFYSDPMRFTVMDARKNFVLMDGRITMLKAVSNGLFVGAGDKTYFLSGLDPAEFSCRQINDSPVLPKSAIKVQGDEIGKNLIGPVVIWAAPEGIYLGLPGGEAKIITPHYEIPPEIQDGAGALVSRDYVQYLYLARCKLTGTALLELMALDLWSTGINIAPEALAPAISVFGCACAISSQEIELCVSKTIFTSYGKSDVSSPNVELDTSTKLSISSGLSGITSSQIDLYGVHQLSTSGGSSAVSSSGIDLQVESEMTLYWRGELGDPDWDENDLVADEQWHTLDASGIVPAGTKAIIVNLYAQSSVVPLAFVLRKHGNTSGMQDCGINTVCSGIIYSRQCTAWLSDDLKFDYQLEPYTYTVKKIWIVGWWK